MTVNLLRSCCKFDFLKERNEKKIEDRKFKKTDGADAWCRTIASNNRPAINRSEVDCRSRYNQCQGRRRDKGNPNFHVHHFSLIKDRKRNNHFIHYLPNDIRVYFIHPAPALVGGDFIEILRKSWRSSRFMRIMLIVGIPAGLRPAATESRNSND